jgi:hypothetical protein
MTDQNVCPYCGWECVEIVGSPYSGIGRGRCPNCQSNGPEVSPPSAALDTFCHPALLLKDKVLISIEDVAEATTTICYSCEKAHICPGARSIPTTLCIVSRLCAAIDAAKGE